MLVMANVDQTLNLFFLLLVLIRTHVKQFLLISKTIVGLHAFFIAMGQIENSTKYLYELFQTVNDKSKLFEFDIKKMNTFQQQDVIKVRKEIIKSTTDSQIRAVNLLEIAELLLEDENIIEAIEYIERSQELIFQNNNNVQPLELARLYKTIDLLWNAQGKYEQALNLFKIILMIYNQHLPAIALQFGSIQSDIAITYFYMGNYILMQLNILIILLIFMCNVYYIITLLLMIVIFI